MVQRAEVFTAIAGDGSVYRIERYEESDDSNGEYLRHWCQTDDGLRVTESDEEPTQFLVRLSDSRSVLVTRS